MATELNKEALPGSQNEPEYFVRFKLSQRIEHIVLMVSFTVLSVTGLAQKFYTADWAQWLILNLGGIAYTRLIHRGFAVLFVLSILYHVAYALNAIFRKHARATMLPTFKDFRDVIDSLRYGFGFTDRHPQFGRFDYKQKFEYWGVIFGSTIIIVSGLFLTYPVFFAGVFPGEYIAAAKEFHGNEATLAAIIIVIWHFYDVIFKPGIFPGDTSIFSGRISRERMIEEHSLEFSEITAETSEGKGATDAAGTPPGKPNPESAAG